ncbi:unnamed protein product [Trichogramma brassicae]|uniref:Uncharacterized protein n=1 Tax=Trichogramma brassicae TaxID=86971 RepID=A0A6H5IGN0_9HYME|nr:unnamed protein product [Trichogramma brassicae]
MDDSTVGVVQVFVGEWSAEYEALSIRATKQTSSTEIVDCIIERLNLPDGNIPNGYELAEVIGNSVGQECKERRLAPTECPVALMLLWPKKNSSQQEYYKFYLRKRQPTDNLWSDSRFPMDPQLLKDYFNRFLHQPKDKEYPDLCQLPDLNERTLLDNLRARFEAGNIYTYVGSILIAVNPFKFYPIYNPKYVKLYQNRRLGTDAPPHIFAIADAAYHSMLKEKRNQCIVISGESGSGKTESTNFLLHHLTALSQKGSHGSGVEQTILSAGPVLEAFGNAKTAHNNNSSRFGKFIQVNYKENGMVHGAVVQKYLLEKSRIVSQGKNERNYHVFYYLLTGANEQEKQVLHLRNSDWYHYLNKSGCYGLENADERHEFSRLKQSMEMVGFTPEKQRRLFAVLSAVLLLGNVEFLPKKSYNHHEEVMVKNPEVVALISELLRVKQETLILSLTAKRVRASGETLVINYRLPEAVAARDAMAKCLYGALFDWIVLQVNHALLSKKETTKDHQGNSIGVLDIFGFEDFKVCNSFEQLCINYANEQLQHYFNQHVFKYEQSEYKKQGIRWTDIDYSDNSGCLNLIEGKPNGLLCLLDDQCKKNKSFRPRERGKKGLKNLQTVKTLAGRTQSYGTGPGKARKQPMTVSAQFQQSLHSLMDTLNQANPFFIRCIKSNSQKEPNEFDEETVQRQLRYTGMLETVRIRQAGFNVRLTYDEFIQLYRMLLPKGLSSTKIDIRDSLLTFNLNRDHYELGQTKIFLRESEKIKLDIELHQQIITSITTIQNWFRACLERRRFLRLRKAVITVQSAVRMWKAKKNYKAILKVKSKAVIRIQSQWRAYRQRRCYKKLREWTIRFQALSRGYLVRKTLPELRKKKKAGVSTVVVNPVISNKEQRDFKTTHDPNLNSLLESERLAQSFDYRNRIAALSNFEPNFETSLPLKPRKLVPVKQSSTTKTFLNNEVNSPTNVSEHRKSSLESIASLQSYESQVSVESLESHQRVSTPPHQQQIQQPQQPQPVPNTRVRRIGTVDSQHTLSTGSSRPSSSSRRTDSSSTGCSDGENDAETPTAVHSAPPVFPSVSSFPSPREFKYQQDVWHKKSEHDYYVPPVVPKPTITRSPNVSQHLHKNMSESLQEQERLNRIERLNMKIGKIDSPMRRRMSEDEIKEYSNLLRKQNSEEIVSNMQTSVTVGLPKEKSEPNVPVRNARRNRPPRDLQCRSMGESVIEVPTEPRNSILNTIKESDLVKDVNVWVQKEESPPNSEWSNKKDSHFKYMPQGTKRVRSGQTPPKMELRRRNSDPTTKTLLGSQIKSSDSPTNDLKPPHNSTLLEWKGSGTQFSLAGHNFRKIARFSKDDVCVCCNEQMDAFVTQGYKCTDCKKPFHVKCIQNGGVVKISCVSGNTPNRRNKRKSPRTPYEQNKQGVSSKFSLTGTSAYSDSTNQIIASEKELGLMEEFIMKKIEIMEVQDDGKKPPSEVDRVFKKALRKFKDELVMTYSVVIQQGNVEGNIKYTDLIANFVQVIENVCKQENLKEDFPVTMGVNAFRGFMNEFMVQAKTESSEKSSKSKRKREKKDKSKKDDPIPHGKHMFQLTIINIPTACELCSSFFMWPIERGLVCQNCRLTSHKKCYRRASKECSKDCPSSVKMDLNSHKVFGVPLSKLDCGDGRIPLVVDRLITTIELHGLYTEGIYRKSGVSSKVKELKNAMDDEGHENIDFKNYQVHVLAAVLKSFLRDMPEPLLTFEYYDDFLHAASLTEPADRVSTLYGILKKLPRPNYDLMERLILHLARVAFHELDNRMSPSALAIVFAPCILRTHRTLPAQDSLQDVGRQTRCVETIVEEKLRALTTTLADINDLDKACTTANKRLSSLRSSKNMSPEELSTTLSNVVSRSAAGPDEEVAALVGHIKTIQQEKALLTSTLPSLTRASSDDDLISANDLDDPSIDDSLVLPSAGPMRSNWALSLSIRRLPKKRRRVSRNSCWSQKSRNEISADLTDAYHRRAGEGEEEEEAGRRAHKNDTQKRSGSG